MEYERNTRSGSVSLPFSNGVNHFLCNCLRRQQLPILCIYFDRKSDINQGVYLY
jgi:hypothetical protein